MSEFLYKGLTRRNLPHIHPPGATLFVTFRLAGTVPQSVLRLYHARKKWFEAETRRIIGLKLQDDSPEVEAHERSLVDFQRRWFVKFEEVLENPIKAKLVKNWRDWKWSYRRKSILQTV